MWWVCHVNCVVVVVVVVAFLTFLARIFIFGACVWVYHKLSHTHSSVRSYVIWFGAVKTTSYIAIPELFCQFDSIQILSDLNFQFIWFLDAEFIFRFLKSTNRIAINIWTKRRCTNESCWIELKLYERWKKSETVVNAKIRSSTQCDVRLCEY